MLEPMLVGDLELSEPIPPLLTPFAFARLLVRLHSRPVGDIVVRVRGGHESPDGLCAQLTDQLGNAINQHLECDGLPGVTSLSPAGLTAATDQLACRRGLTSTTPPTASVVIATRDRSDALARCLDSVAALDYPNFDVIVVDSAPSDDSTRRLLSHPSRWPLDVTYARAGRPGLAIAHNTAIPLITGEITAFTDDDVVVDRHWLSAMTAPFHDRRVGCVTGLILPGQLDTAPQLWLEQSGGFSRGLETHTFGLDLPNDDPLFPFDAGRLGSGANMAFRTSWLRHTGGFDEATGAGTVARGGDDLLAFLQVVLDGHHLVYEPAAIIRHWHRRDYEGLDRQMFSYGVGLGAYLAAAVRRQPSLVWPMLARSVDGLRHIVSGTSVKNSGKAPGYPSRFDRRERLGILTGPVAYARSVRMLTR